MERNAVEEVESTPSSGGSTPQSGSSGRRRPGRGRAPSRRFQQLRSSVPGSTGELDEAEEEVPELSAENQPENTANFDLEQCCLVNRHKRIVSISQLSSYYHQLHGGFKLST